MTLPGLTSAFPDGCRRGRGRDGPAGPPAWTYDQPGRKSGFQ
jgi:hypothetical protein